MTCNASLDAALRQAHDAADGRGLAALYASAADMAGDVDAECFYLVQAYVHALEQDVPSAARLHARLKARGREE